MPSHGELAGAKGTDSPSSEGSEEHILRLKGSPHKPNSITRPCAQCTCCTVTLAVCGEGTGDAVALSRRHDVVVAPTSHS
eukprot:scaffold68738_cov37-Tisochrysis_lutea.AAC.2